MAQPIREEALRGLTILAIHDPRFLSGVVSDPEDTLSRYGFNLTEDEWGVVRNFLSHAADLTLTEEDLTEGEKILHMLTSESGPEVR